MSDFRKSRDLLGGVNVIRKDSKYDKNSKEDVKRKRNYSGKQMSDEDAQPWADRDVGKRVQMAAELAKESSHKGNKDAGKNYDYYEGSSRRSDRSNAHENKTSTGRKDFPFFKHKTKGK